MLTKVLGADGQAEVAQRMPHNLAVRIEEGAERVANHPMVAKTAHFVGRNDRLLSKHRGFRKFSDADEIEIRRPREFHGVAHHALRHEHVSIFDAVGDERNWQEVHLAARAQRERLHYLEGIRD
jgi:hypothetical protein